MSFTVSSVGNSEPNAFNGLTKTYLTTPDKKVYYVFTKPENVPSEGDVLEGYEVTRDKKGAEYLKRVKRADQQQFAGDKAPQPARGFKADPDKLRQVLTLETARNLSIQRQVAVKGAIELLIAEKREDLRVTFIELMGLLTARDWNELAKETFIDGKDDDQPPVENYENLGDFDPNSALDSAIDEVQS